jgi:hypothetical protein
MRTASSYQKCIYLRSTVELPVVRMRLILSWKCLIVTAHVGVEHVEDFLPTSISSTFNAKQQLLMTLDPFSKVTTRRFRLTPRRYWDAATMGDKEKVLLATFVVIELQYIVSSSFRLSFSLFCPLQILILSCLVNNLHFFLYVVIEYFPHHNQKINHFETALNFKEWFEFAIEFRKLFYSSAAKSFNSRISSNILKEDTYIQNLVSVWFGKKQYRQYV